MPLLIIGMLRAIWTLRRDPQFVSLALLTVIAIATGTGFYSVVEGLRFVDAFYFSVITLTTVGYGDFAPETDAGKVFTAVYVLVGIGILLAFATTIAAKMAKTTRALSHRAALELGTRERTTQWRSVDGSDGCTNSRCRRLPPRARREAPRGTRRRVARRLRR